MFVSPTKGPNPLWIGERKLEKNKLFLEHKKIKCNQFSWEAHRALISQRHLFICESHETRRQRRRMRKRNATRTANIDNAPTARIKLKNSKGEEWILKLLPHNSTCCCHWSAASSLSSWSLSLTAYPSSAILHGLVCVCAEHFHLCCRD